MKMVSNNNNIFTNLSYHFYPELLKLYFIDVIIQKKQKQDNKRPRGLDTTSVKATKLQKEDSLEKFVQPKDSKDARFHEFQNKELGKEDNDSPAVKRKAKEIFKDLYKLPDEIDYANYNQNRDVIDRKHWIAGLAEVDVDKNAQNRDPSDVPPVNEVAKALNAEAIEESRNMMMQR